jgi:competence protein ComEA
MNHYYRSYVQALVASLLPVAAWAGPVNVNSADAATLARELDGIGPVKAQAIDGIGERVLEQNRANIRIDKAGPAAPAAKPAPRN